MVSQLIEASMVEYRSRAFGRVLAVGFAAFAALNVATYLRAGDPLALVRAVVNAAMVVAVTVRWRHVRMALRVWGGFAAAAGGVGLLRALLSGADALLTGDLAAATACLLPMALSALTLGVGVAVYRLSGRYIVPAEGEAPLAG